MISVWENKQYVHIKYGYNNLCTDKYMVRTNTVRVIKGKLLVVINIRTTMERTE